MPTLLDGGLATSLQPLGLPVATPVEDFVDDEAIRSVQRAFMDAGAQILLTASFRSLPSERPDWTATLDRGVRLAREAAEGRARVYLSLGPGAGHGLAVARAGDRVDGVVLETFVDPSALRSAVVEVRARTALPVIACLVPSDEGGSRDGRPLAEVARELLAAGADGIGLNCMPSAAVRAAVEALPDLPIWAKPNGGPAPEDLALLVQRCTWLGGCCGTDPAKIREIGNFLVKAMSTASEVS